MSFHIPQYSMTALVGKSGCGKSTIVNLIARFWDTDSGMVSIGGTDIKAMTTESLLENISVVFQNVYLLTIPFSITLLLEKRCNEGRGY